MNETIFNPLSAEEIIRSHRKKRECDYEIKKEQRNLNKSIGGKC